MHHSGDYTLKQIAQQYNCTTDKIRYHLQKNNAWKLAYPGKCNLPEQQIIELYKQDLTPKQISEKYNVSVGPIVSILNKHKVRKPCWAKLLPYKTYQRVIDKQLFQQVCEQQISKKNIAQYFDINYDMVASLCKRHNIELPNSAEVRSLLNQQHSKLGFTKHTVYQLHHQQRIPICDIATQLNVSTNYLRKKMKSWGISVIGPEIRLSSEFLQLRENPDKLKKEVEVELKTLSQLTQKYNVSHELLRKLIDDNDIKIPIKYRSTGEQQVEQFILQHLQPHQISICDRTLIPPQEIDIYMPQHKLAIEYCGLYWHSHLTGKDRNYHLNKLQQCQEKGIQLLTIFEDEWINKQQLCENRILQCLNLFNGNKINARQCIVQPINYNIKKQFLNQFHIQGNDVCKIQLGLFYNDQLVSVMTFSKPSRARASQKMVDQVGLWELNRYASDYNYHVRGGGGKLLKYFKNNYQWDTIYSYADRRWSQGNMYQQLNFELVSTSKPNYWYSVPGYHKREYRYNYTKGKLVKQGHDPQLTEFQIMDKLGAARIWDCGMLKFEIKKGA